MADSLFDQIRARGEAFLTDVSNNLMANPRFVEMLKKGMEAKEAIDQQVTEALKKMNVANRREVKSLEHRVTTLEAELHDLKEKISKPARKSAPRKR